jgi:hypothetical protein
VSFAAVTPCAGCGEPTPTRVGEDASFGEWLKSPLGICFRRTHRVRECVEASRAAVEGRPVVLGPTREERKREELGL